MSFLQNLLAASTAFNTAQEYAAAICAAVQPTTFSTRRRAAQGLCERHSCARVLCLMPTEGERRAARKAVEEQVRAILPDMFEGYVTDEHLWIIADAAVWAAEDAGRKGGEDMKKGTGRLKSPDHGTACMPFLSVLRRPLGLSRGRGAPLASSTRA